MRIHLIAIGGKVMHNLALELKEQGHLVTGSDDEIYDPARTRLDVAGLLPHSEGWDAERITSDIDQIILGMHAHLDNPELIRAQELGLLITSFPEYIGKAIENKRSVVVCGSHGKSTTTAMLMHALQEVGIKADYALGGMLDGFDRMVSLGDAPIAIIEGDEYLSSRLNPTPKMWHYHGNIVILTGIEWDHINVFPTLENYIDQFRILIKQSVEERAKIIWYAADEHLEKLMAEVPSELSIPYHALEIEDQKIYLDRESYTMEVFGQHNLANMQAALQSASLLDMDATDFLRAMSTFRGVGKRLELISSDPIVYIDYAHAPSKVRATVEAVRSKHPDQKILSVYELHTYSSLNAAFIPNYIDTLSKSDKGVVFYNEHALKMKRMPELEKEVVKMGFGSDVEVFNQKRALEKFFKSNLDQYDVILFMSSGSFDGIPIREMFK